MHGSNKKSPLRPEDYSLIEVWCQSVWFSYHDNLELVVRTSIMFICISHAVASSLCFLDSSVVSPLIQILCTIHTWTLSLHTLMICRGKMDRLYLLHFILYTIIAVYEDAHFSITKGGLLMALIYFISITILIFAYVFWSIPTRLLYYKTFHLARMILKVDGDYLLNACFKYWACGFSISLFLEGIGFWFTIATTFNVDLFRSGIWAFSLCIISVFEIEMYSLINPLKEDSNINFLAKMYYFATITYALIGLGCIISEFIIMSKMTVGILFYTYYSLLTVMYVIRYIVLWYYCVEELISKNKHEESKFPEEKLFHSTRIDLSKITKEETVFES